MLRLAIVMALATSACVRSQALVCADGRTCPIESTCDNVNHTCIPAGCGDGELANLEQCDGDNFGDIDCTTFGYYRAEGLACTSVCTIDMSGCMAAGFCGDHELNGSESCDGVPPLGLSCIDYGFDYGRVSCSSGCEPGFEDCAVLGWHPVPANASAGLEAIWIAGSRMIAVGRSGTILMAIGEAWPQVSSGTTADLFGVWGSGANDVFAVGADGTIVHFDGTTWTAMVSGTTTTLRAVTGTSPSDVTAVGDAGTIIHFDGTTWSAMTSGTNVNLRGVYATSLLTVAVGEATSAGTDSPTILQRIGGVWSPMSAPAMTVEPELVPALNAVWGIGDQLFAVGTRRAIYRFDGSSWTIAQGPFDFAPHLTAVWGRALDDVYFAGQFGTVLHYTTVFSSQTTKTSHSLDGIAGDGTRVFIATGAGTILRNDGTDVTTDAAVINGTLRAVWRSGNIATAVGDGYVVNYVDGAGWGTPFQILNILMQPTLDPYAVFGLGQYRFVVGKGGASRGSNNGAASGNFASPQVTNQTYYGVWASAQNDAYAVGTNVASYNGTLWQGVNTFTPGRLLRAITGWSPTEMIVVGDGGYVARFNGTSGTPLDSGVTSTLYAVWGTSRDNFYVVGAGGTILHYDGTAFQRVLASTNEDLFAISGTSDSDIFVGGSGTLLHFDGTNWTPFRVEFGEVRGAWATQDTAMLVGRDGGAKVIRRPHFTREQDCDDPWDDDGDGNVNCADDDCSGAATCSAGGACTVIGTLACGDSLEGSTFTSTAKIDQLTCVDHELRGPEGAYQLVGTGGMVTLTLTPRDPASALELAVLDAYASSACDLSACTPATGTPRTVTFATEAGALYYVLVDGSANVADEFTLSAACP